jgi:hypothetical protein
MRTDHLNFDRIQGTPQFSAVVQRAVVTYPTYISEAFEERHTALAQAEFLCTEWGKIEGSFKLSPFALPQNSIHLR